MDPPPGISSNFVNPSSFRLKSLGLPTSLLIIVTFVFIVWGYTKVKVQKKLHPEDYIIALAYVSIRRSYHLRIQLTFVLLGRVPCPRSWWVHDVRIKSGSAYVGYDRSDANQVLQGMSNSYQFQDPYINRYTAIPRWCHPISGQYGDLESGHHAAGSPSFHAREYTRLGILGRPYLDLYQCNVPFCNGSYGVESMHSASERVGSNDPG